MIKVDGMVIIKDMTSIPMNLSYLLEETGKMIQKLAMKNGTVMNLDTKNFIENILHPPLHSI